MKIAFFTEAGSDVGMGHLIRSYAIYDKFKKEGWKCDFFVCSEFECGINELKCVIYFKGWEQINDSFLKDEYDIIFIDSYKAEIVTYNVLCKKANLCVFLDDYGRLDYPPGVIINFSPDAEKFFSRKKPNSYYLLGTKFIPLRPFFKENCGMYSKESKKEHVLIMIGGFDSSNMSLLIADKLRGIKTKKVIITANPNSEGILENSISEDIQILFKPTSKKLVSVMINSKIAIITASMVAYELSCLGVPSLALAISNDQRIGIESLMRHKIIQDLVDISNKEWTGELKLKVERSLMENEAKNISNSIVDGNGVNRIYTKIIEIWKSS